MNEINVNGRDVKLDGEGYLFDFKEWEKDIGLALAEHEKLKMTDDHWTVVDLLRGFYSENESIPTARDISKLMGDTLGQEKSTSKYLAELFLNEPIKQSCRIAGLPKMPGCT